MKRTPLRRKKRMRRKKNDGKRFAKHFHSEERVRWIQAQPCPSCGGEPCVNAHRKSRGAGGTWRDVLPLCDTCHRDQHSWGWPEFEACSGIDGKALAAGYARAWDERTEGE